VATVNIETLLLIFVACTFAAVLMQAIVLLGLLITARKALKTAQQQFEELRTDVFPVIKDTKQLLVNVGPKIESVANDVADLTGNLRAQSARLEISAGEILERIHRQTNRIDAMLTNVLNTADRAGAVVADVISVPVRQLAGFAAFARAAVTSLRGAPRSAQPEPRPQSQPQSGPVYSAAGSAAAPAAQPATKVGNQ
jgi:hypothetical protein